MFAKDSESAFGALRQERVQAVVVVGMLAGMIAFGVVYVHRSTERELEMSRMRSDFVSNVFHELRTPLQSIQMHAERLAVKRYCGEEQLDRYIQTISKESNRLARMVTNVLDFSRLESGRTVYRFAEADVSGMVRRTVDEFQAVAEEAGFLVDVSYGPPAGARVDAEKIDHAIANLIGNAMKYSTGRKELSRSVGTVDSGMVITVSDRGIGIPPEDQEQIFEKFSRGSNVTDETGAGLGLALVQETVRAHGGDVLVTDRKGGGTTFTLRIPLEHAM